MRFDGIEEPARPNNYRVAIIGGGFSGTAQAIRLLRSTGEPLPIVVVNRAGLPGRGVAYGTDVETHILNVGAGKMSVLSDDPGHFVRWATRKIGNQVRPDHFLPRRLYGEYLEDTLRLASEESRDVVLSWISGDVISLTLKDSGLLLGLANGQRIQAEFVILATGNEAPCDPEPVRGLSRRVYAPYAWSDDALDGIPTFGRVLILGTGLTAIDQVLSLRERGFDGTIWLLSRRGLLPCGHSDSSIWPQGWTEFLPDTACLLLRAVRQQIGEAKSAGVDWRAVIDSLRPRIPCIWERLPARERSRFLRHLRPYWEVVRHRIPQSTALCLSELIATGRVRVLAGQLLEATELEACADIVYCDRGSQQLKTLVADKLINCTGPSVSRRVHDGLARRLLQDGLARLDPLGMGLETDAEGALISAAGKPQERIFTLGPVRKASSWEVTAVPEIREQVNQIAGRILSHSNLERNALPVT